MGTGIVSWRLLQRDAQLLQCFIATANLPQSVGQPSAHAMTDCRRINYKLKTKRGITKRPSKVLNSTDELPLSNAHASTLVQKIWRLREQCQSVVRHFYGLLNGSSLQV